MTPDNYPYLPPSPEALKARQQWVADLRSGKYQQTTGSLRVDLPSPAFCCLGVACDRRVKEDKGSWSEFGFRDFQRLADGSIQESATRLTSATAKSLGFLATADAANTYNFPTLNAGEEHTTPYVLFQGRLASLVHLNDEVKLSFEQIADLIEASHITPFLKNEQRFLVIDVDYEVATTAPVTYETAMEIAKARARTINGGTFVVELKHKVVETPVDPVYDITNY